MRALWLAVALAGAAAGTLHGHGRGHAQASADTALATRVHALVDDAIARHSSCRARWSSSGTAIACWSARRSGRGPPLPAREPMTLDTIFDAASLTKVVATTTSVMQLVEEGRLRLVDPVSRYVPGFERYGKRDITVRHLLTHTSGLRPDVDLADPWSGAEHAHRARRSTRCRWRAPTSASSTATSTSSCSGGSSRRSAGCRSIATRRNASSRRSACATPASGRRAALVPRIAPTERCPPNEPCVPGAAATPAPPMLRGVVHDPTARRMGGVAGHAGLFTTADDLARFCRMLLGQGTLDGRAHPLAADGRPDDGAVDAGRRSANVRGLGWDLDSSFSSNRGELFPIGSFGHTGFTGTSIWIDPATSTLRGLPVEPRPPRRQGRRRAAAGAASRRSSPRRSRRPRRPPPTPPRPPKPRGAHRARRRRGRRARAAARRSSPASTCCAPRASRASPARKVGAAHQPHRRRPRRHVDDRSPARGEGPDAGRAVQPRARHPRHARREGAVGEGREDRPADPLALRRDAAADRRDARRASTRIVFDLQDVGVRFYTYAATMGLVMEEAAKREHRGRGARSAEPDRRLADRGADSATRPRSASRATCAMPIRHGLTLGELARLFNGERKIGAKLTVVPMPALAPRLVVRRHRRCRGSTRRRTCAT